MAVIMKMFGMRIVQGLYNITAGRFLKIILLELSIDKLPYILALRAIVYFY